MASNKKKREELESIYGKGSMFKKAKVDEYLEKIKGIKTYKKFVSEGHFTRKQRLRYEQTMTYHHMRHLSEGGSTTKENGAIVNGLEHIYLHSIPREHEEIINNRIRKWKINFVAISQKGVSDHKQVEIDLNQDYIEIPVYKSRKRNKSQIIERQRKRENKQFQKQRKENEDRWQQLI